MNAYLLALRHTPTILDRILDEVPGSRFGERVSEDRFTLLEMVCHLADFEDLALERMRTALHQDGAEVPNWDEGQRAIDKRYGERNPREEMQVFANRRRDTITFVEERTDEELGRAITKEGLGRVTIQEYLALISGHDLYHLEQATWYLKGVHGKE